MIVVIFFRWLRGYLYIQINGSFPERFLNLCSKRGISLWKLDSSGDALSVCCRLPDRQAVFKAAEKSGCAAEIKQEKGLPSLIRKYKYRAGLLAGAVMGAAFCLYMSGFIWNISIIAPDDISEYEIRRELRENGLYEGIRYDYYDVSRTERQLRLADNRISWVSINVFGTNAVVELSAKQEITGTKQQEEAPSGAVSNLISAADGTVTRLEIQSGSAAVQPGDGIRKGQLLVSGVMEYTNGGNALTDSRGKVFAKVTKTITLELPEKAKKPLPASGRSITKTDAGLFGITFPLSLESGIKNEAYYCRKSKYRMVLLGNDLPFIINEQSFYPYKNKTEKIPADKAKQMLESRYRLYEFFLTADKDISVIERKTEFVQKNGKYVLKVLLVTEENICSKSFIDVKLDNDPDP